MKRLTAKRIASLRKKLRRYKLYMYNSHRGDFDRISVLWGLNFSDAISRYCHRLNKNHLWNDRDFKLNVVLYRNEADHALLPLDSDKKKDVIWLRGYFV